MLEKNIANLKIVCKHTWRWKIIWIKAADFYTITKPNAAYYCYLFFRIQLTNSFWGKGNIAKEIKTESL